METQRLAVAVMHCEKCVANVTRHYEDLPGVAAVAVDLAAQTAAVTYDPDRTTRDDLQGGRHARRGPSPLRDGDRRRRGRDGGEGRESGCGVAVRACRPRKHAGVGRRRRLLGCVGCGG